MSNKVLTWVWDHAPVTGADLLIMLAIADQANDDGECFMLKATIARKARIHPDTLDRRLPVLERDGLIQRVIRAGRSSTYRITPPQETPRSETPRSPTPPAGDPPHPPVSDPPTPRSETPPYPFPNPEGNPDKPANGSAVAGSEAALFHVEPPEQSPVQVMVARYAEVVAGTGGYLSTDHAKAIGQNVKRIIEKDGGRIPLPVILAAVETAAKSGRRDIGTILAAPSGPMSSWERNGAARAVMHDQWEQVAAMVRAGKGQG